MQELGFDAAVAIHALRAEEEEYKRITAKKDDGKGISTEKKLEALLGKPGATPSPAPARGARRLKK